MNKLIRKVKAILTLSKNKKWPVVQLIQFSQRIQWEIHKWVLLLRQIDRVCSHLVVKEEGREANLQELSVRVNTSGTWAHHIWKLIILMEPLMMLVTQGTWGRKEWCQWEKGGLLGPIRDRIVNNICLIILFQISHNLSGGGLARLYPHWRWEDKIWIRPVLYSQILGSQVAWEEV